MAALILDYKMAHGGTLCFGAVAVLVSVRRSFYTAWRPMHVSSCAIPDVTRATLTLSVTTTQ